MEDIINKRVKVFLKNRMFYNGRVLSQGEDWIKIRDLKDSIVFIKIDEINVLEELE